MSKKHYQALVFDDSPSSERMFAKQQRVSKSQVRSCQKVRLSREQAKDVVRRASFSRAFNAAHGLPEGPRREIRSYKCACGGWHTTSRADFFTYDYQLGVSNEAAA